MISKTKFFSTFAVFLILVSNAGCKKQAAKPVQLNQGDELVKVFEIEDSGKDHKLMVQTDRLPAKNTVRVNINGKTLGGSFSSDTTDGINLWYSFPVSKANLKKINGVVIKNLSSSALTFNCDQLEKRNSACGIKRLNTKSRLTKLTVSPRVKLVDAATVPQ